MTSEIMNCTNCAWYRIDKCINGLSVYKDYVVNNLILCPYWDQKTKSDNV